MDDGSSHSSSLKKEWSLLLQGFVEAPEEENQPRFKVPDKVQSFAEKCRTHGLSLNDLEQYSKYLSQTKQKIYQHIEDIKRDIEQSLARIENLDLVGSETEHIYQEINQLNSNGEELSKEILKIEDQVKIVRDAQRILTETDSTL